MTAAVKTIPLTLSLSEAKLVEGQRCPSDMALCRETCFDRLSTNGNICRVFFRLTRAHIHAVERFERAAQCRVHFIVNHFADGCGGHRFQ